jgi:hypothetical protein
LLNRSFVEKTGLSNWHTSKNLLTTFFTLSVIAKIPKKWILADCIEYLKEDVQSSCLRWNFNFINKRLNLKIDLCLVIYQNFNLKIALPTTFQGCDVKMALTGLQLQ